MRRRDLNTMHPVAVRWLQREEDYIERALELGPMLGIDTTEANRRRQLVQRRAWEYSDDLHRHPSSTPHIHEDFHGFV